MKKTLLLSVLCAAGISAFAATSIVKPAVTALEDGKTYYIYDAHGDDGTTVEVSASDARRYVFRYDDGDKLWGTHVKPANASSQVSDPKYVWKAVASDDSSWKFQNMGTSNWIGETAATVEEDAAQPLVLNLNAGTTDKFQVAQQGTNKGFDGNANGSFTYWNGGHPIQFYLAVTDDEGATYDLDATEAWEASVNFTIDGESYQTSVFSGLPNSTVTITYPAFCSGDVAEVTIDEDGKTIDVPVTVSLPFAVSESFDNAKWQAVYIHSGGWLNNHAAWTYDPDDASVKATSVSPVRDEAYDDVNLFAFVGSLKEGFRIYNKAAGANLTLDADEDDRGMVEDGAIFDIVASRTNSAETHACFKAQGGTNLINGQGWNYETKIGLLKGWWDADQGSSCWFVAMYGPVVNKYASVPSGIVGGYADGEAVAAAIAAANPYTGEGIDALEDAVANAEIITFDTAKAYRLRNVANGQYMVADNNGNLNTTADGVKANHNTIIQFVENEPAEAVEEGEDEGEGEEEAEPTYTILVNGAPISNCTQSTQVTIDEEEMPEAAVYKIYNLDDAETIFVFYDSADEEEGVQYPGYSYLHKSNQNTIVGWEYSDIKSQWYLELVTEVEIAATETYNHYVYAAHLPVSVEAAEGTVLNIVEERNGLLDNAPYLAKVAVDMAPANVPFIIDGADEEGAAIALNVVYDRELPDVSKSVLSGVLRAAEVDATEHYVLGENGNGELGFFHADDEDADYIAVAHNGVWLHASNTATAEAGGYLLRAAEVGVTGITISETEITLSEGETATLTAAVTPDDAINAETIVWTSSDETVATVDADGTVTAVAPGTAVITAAANGFEATCTVNVKEETRIAEISAAGAAAAYDLQGRRASAATRGIVISNGVKTIRK